MSAETFPCPHDGCGFVGTSMSGRTRHVQAIHPDRISALLRASKRPVYPVERPRALALCVHRYSEGGDLQLHDGWAHVRTCKHCGQTTTRSVAECTPMNCVTQRRMVFGFGHTK